MGPTRRLLGVRLPPARRRVYWLGLVCLASAVLLAACSGPSNPTVTSEPTATPPHSIPTATLGTTPTPAVTPGPGGTPAVPGPTGTSAATPEPTGTPAATPGPTGTPAATPMPTGTPSATPGPTATPPPEATPRAPVDRYQRAGDWLWVYEVPGIRYVVGGPDVVILRIDPPIYEAPSELRGLDAETGSVLWRYQADDAELVDVLVADGSVFLVTVEYYAGPLVPVDPPPTPGSTPTPIPPVEVVVLALDAPSGEPLWQWSKEVEAGTYVGLVSASGRVLYLNLGDSVLAMDVGTGDQLWSSEGRGAAVLVDGGILYRHTVSAEGYPDATEALDAATGDVLWRIESDPGGYYTEAATDAGIVYFTHYYGIEARNAATGERMWQHEPEGRQSFFGNVANGVVTVTSSRISTSFYPEINLIDRLCALDARTGQSLWCIDIDTEEFYVYEVHVGDVVYVPTVNRMSALHARTGGLLWRYDLEVAEGGIVIPWASAAEGLLHFSLDGVIHGLDAATGSLLWRYKMEEELIRRPYVADGIFYAKTERELVVFSASPPSAADGARKPKPSPTPTPTPSAECLNGVAVPDPDANPGLVRDCMILLTIRDTLAGEGTLDWSADVPIADWEGVQLMERGLRVRVLRLGGLSGTIPPELGELSELDYLRLDGNRLTGNIPKELKDLAKLEYLHLNNNLLTGGIPGELGELANLRELSLSENRLTGEVPAELGSLSKLRWLQLGGNRLVGEIPAELSILTHLKVLDLSRNLLTGKVPMMLSNLTNLKRLYLNENQLTGMIPLTLSNLTNLKRLYLNNNQLTGPVPKELGSLGNLESLRLSGNQLTGCLPLTWRGIGASDLNELGLEYCGAAAARTIVEH